MTKHGPASEIRESSDSSEETEKRLEEELLTQEHLESLAWPIWSDLKTRIVRAVKVYNASPGRRPTLQVDPRQMPYQILIESDPKGPALRVELNTQTGVISFGNPALTNDERLVIRIEGESSYRIERYPAAESINPSELADVILSNFLSLIDGSPEQTDSPSDSS